MTYLTVVGVFGTFLAVACSDSTAEFYNAFRHDQEEFSRQDCLSHSGERTLHDLPFQRSTEVKNYSGNQGSIQSYQIDDLGSKNNFDTLDERGGKLFQKRAPASIVKDIGQLRVFNQDSPENSELIKLILPSVKPSISKVTKGLPTTIRWKLVKFAGVDQPEAKGRFTFPKYKKTTPVCSTVAQKSRPTHVKLESWNKSPSSAARETTEETDEQAVVTSTKVSQLSNDASSEQNFVSTIPCTITSGSCFTTTPYTVTETDKTKMCNSTRAYLLRTLPKSGAIMIIQGILAKSNYTDKSDGIRILQLKPVPNKFRVKELQQTTEPCTPEDSERNENSLNEFMLSSVETSSQSLGKDKKNKQIEESKKHSEQLETNKGHSTDKIKSAYTLFPSKDTYKGTISIKLPSSTTACRTTLSCRTTTACRTTQPCRTTSLETHDSSKAETSTPEADSESDEYISSISSSTSTSTCKSKAKSTATSSTNKTLLCRTTKQAQHTTLQSRATQPSCRTTQSSRTSCRTTKASSRSLITGTTTKKATVSPIETTNIGVSACRTTKATCRTTKSSQKTTKAVCRTTIPTFTTSLICKTTKEACRTTKETCRTTQNCRTTKLCRTTKPTCRTTLPYRSKTTRSYSTTESLKKTEELSGKTETKEETDETSEAIEEKSEGTEDSYTGTEETSARTEETSTMTEETTDVTEKISAETDETHTETSEGSGEYSSHKKSTTELHRADETCDTAIPHTETSYRPKSSGKTTIKTTLPYTTTLRSKTTSSDEVSSCDLATDKIKVKSSTFMPHKEKPTSKHGSKEETTRCDSLPTHDEDFEHEEESAEGITPRSLKEEGDLIHISCSPEILEETTCHTFSDTTDDSNTRKRLNVFFNNTESMFLFFASFDEEKLKSFADTLKSFLEENKNRTDMNFKITNNKCIFSVVEIKELFQYLLDLLLEMFMDEDGDISDCDNTFDPDKFSLVQSCGKDETDDRKSSLINLLYYLSGNLPYENHNSLEKQFATGNLPSVNSSADVIERKIRHPFVKKKSINRGTLKKILKNSYMTNVIDKSPHLQKCVSRRTTRFQDRVDPRTKLFLRKLLLEYIKPKCDI